MAKLVMTIDSDEEVSTALKRGLSGDDEQIYLNSDMVITQTDHQVKEKMWSFKDAVVLGKHAQSLA
jgi:hypothetical protein